MKIENWGETYDVTVVKTNYNSNGNLAIQLVCDDGSPYGTLTVNLDKKLPNNQAYVDINNMPNAAQFIEENHLGRFLDDFGFSGYCMYPLYEFV